MRIAAFLVLSLAPLGQAGSPGYFVPAHTVSGIGVARDDISEELLQTRTDLMIQSQTFGILREPRPCRAPDESLPTPNSRPCFVPLPRAAACPASLIEAIAYLESWGDARAESPAGPRGIMQISEATAHSMGLKVLHATRYKIVKERVKLASTGRKPKYRIITHKIPYTVTVRDERLIPERAIPAAARYLAGMERKFGGRDWAIFAYHCGQGCVSEMQELTRRAHGIPRARSPCRACTFPPPPPGTASSIRPFSSRCSATTRPLTISASSAPRNCWRCTAATRARSRPSPQEYRNQFLRVRAPHRLAVVAQARRPGVPHRRRYQRRPRQASGAGAFDRPEYFGYSSALRRRAAPASTRRAGGNRRPGLRRVRDAPPVRGNEARGRSIPAAAGHLAGGIRGRRPAVGPARGPGARLRTGLRHRNLQPRSR